MSSFTLVIDRSDGTRLALDLADPDDHAADWQDACECDECDAYWAAHKLAMEIPDDLGRWTELSPEALVGSGSAAVGLTDDEFEDLLAEERQVHAEVTRARRRGGGLDR